VDIEQKIKAHEKELKDLKKKNCKDCDSTERIYQLENEIERLKKMLDV
jgi:cell division protein FtsL